MSCCKRFAQRNRLLSWRLVVRLPGIGLDRSTIQMSWVEFLSRDFRYTRIHLSYLSIYPTLWVSFEDHLILLRLFFEEIQWSIYLPTPTIYLSVYLSVYLDFVCVCLSCLLRVCHFMLKAWLYIASFCDFYLWPGWIDWIPPSYNGFHSALNCQSLFQW